MKDKYAGTLEEIYRLYNFFLNHFNPELAVKEAKVFFTIQSRHGKKVLGHFAPESWSDGEHNYHEINLAAEKLNRSVTEICETLLHECVHLHNNTLGIIDANFVNQYHNKHFKSRCSAWGLKASIMPGRGYALTELTEEGVTAIDLAKPNPDAFKIKRIEHLKEKKDSEYIAVTLKKEVWEEIIQKEIDTKDLKNAKSVVELALEKYFQVDAAELKALAA